MTVEILHDALNLLPGDLVTATDKLRTAPKTRAVPWKRLLPVAACFVLLFGLGMVIRKELPDHIMMQKDAAAEAPAAAAPMAPAPMEQEMAADEAKKEEPAAEAPAEDAMGSNSVTGEENGLEEELYIDHSHRFAEEESEDKPAVGYCGNMMTTIYLDGGEYSFAGSDSVAVTDILIHLDYEPDHVCRCMAEFRVDTEMLPDIEVNLSQAFARCEKGQAALTQEQVKTIRQIIDSLK